MTKCAFVKTDMRFKNVRLQFTETFSIKRKSWQICLEFGRSLEVTPGNFPVIGGRKSDLIFTLAYT